MESFLKFVFILILIWLGFRLFIRYVFPWLLMYWVKRKQKKMMEQMGINPDAFTQEDKEKKDGEVSIDKNPKKDKKGSTENMGEYVDFEDVDD
jgi:hypothetical protein